MLDKLFDWLHAAWQWIKDFGLWIAQEIWHGVITAVTAVLAAIPVPSWVSSIDFSGVSPSIAYFGAPFHFETGLAVLISAYVLRFLIRRIPVIG